MTTTRPFGSVGWDDVAHVYLTDAGDAINRGCQPGIIELYFRRFDERLVRFDGTLQLRHLGLLGIEELRGGIAFGRQLGVATEIGLRVRKLGEIAIAGGGHLVHLGLVGTRIDLRKEVAGMHGLPFGEGDADDLSLDLAAHQDRVVGDNRADAAKIDRHVLTAHNAGNDRYH